MGGFVATQRGGVGTRLNKVPIKVFKGSDNNLIGRGMTKESAIKTTTLKRETWINSASPSS